MDSSRLLGYLAMFQSPCGDSLFSDLYVCNKTKAGKTWKGFNPLAGIRCFLTKIKEKKNEKNFYFCFNPLAGIRCFLTTMGMLF